MALKITIVDNELFDFCKVEPGVDASTVNLLLKSAKSEAEGFLNTDFSTTTTNPDGSTTTTEVEAPDLVKLWVFNRVAQLYDNRGTGQATTPDFKILQPLRVYPFLG